MYNVKINQLLFEEQLVIKWLSQYGALPIGLIREWLFYKPNTIQDKIFKNLLTRGFIYQPSENIFTIDPTQTIPNEDIVLAGWVLARFKDIDPQAHYPARYPAQIHFIDNNYGVDVMVVHPGMEHLLYLLEPQEQLRYILVIQNMDMLSMPISDDIHYLVAYAPSCSDISFYTRRDLSDTVHSTENTPNGGDADPYKIVP